jgi:hypothetical protein
MFAPAESLQELNIEIPRGFAKKTNASRREYTMSQLMFMEALFQEGNIKFLSVRTRLYILV